MRVSGGWNSTYEFACRSKACAPPPVGTGGSEDAIAARIQARRDATAQRLSTSSMTPKGAGHGFTTDYGAPITDEMLRNASASFINVRSPETFSGYKAHVYATDIKGTNEILERIRGDVESRGWGMKVATQRFHEHTANGHKQAGKAITIYFPNKATAERDIARLVQLMSDLPAAQRAGKIVGDDMRGNGVGVRYELSKNAPDRDLDPDEYHKFYDPA